MFVFVVLFASALSLIVTAEVVINALLFQNAYIYDTKICLNLVPLESERKTKITLDKERVI